MSRVMEWLQYVSDNWEKGTVWQQLQNPDWYEQASVTSTWYSLV